VLVRRRGDLPSLLSVAAKVLTGGAPAEPLEHWQARRIRVEVEPRQAVTLDGEMVEGADRQLKDRFGTLAYALSGLQALRDPPMARYTLTLDGQLHETEGMTCIIANTGSVGRTNLTLAPTIDVGDGLLDVIVVRRGDVPSLLSVAAKVLTGGPPAEPLQHWQARRVRVEVEPAQAVTLDGEMIEVAPIDVEVVPSALRVIVPRGARGVNQ
jgi:diacylglycerol kinase family enzyme